VRRGASAAAFSWEFSRLLVSVARMRILALALLNLSLSANELNQARITPEQAKAFVERVNKDLKRLWVKSQTAEWIRDNFITDDTEQNAAWVNEEVLAYLSTAIKESAKFRGLQLDPETARALYLLRVTSQLPAPSDPAKRSEIAAIASKLQGLYGKGKWCGPDRKGPCRDLEQLSDVMSQSHNYEEDDLSADASSLPAAGRAFE